MQELSRNLTPRIVLGLAFVAVGTALTLGNLGYEVTNKDLEELIVQKKNSTEILLAARANGFMFLFEDGLDKAKAGLTTVEELLRIAAPPEEIYFTKHEKEKTKPSKGK